MRKNKSYSQSHASNAQFSDVLNNPDKYIIHAKNYKLPVNLICGFKSNDNYFDQMYDLIQQAYDQKQQIIFNNFAISWDHVDNKVVPVLIYSHDQLLSNLYVLNLFKHHDENVRNCFIAFNNLTKKQLTEQNLYLLLVDKLMIFYQDHQQYGILFSY